MLTLTFKSEKAQIERDIQVNPQQKIEDTLSILQEAGLLTGIETEQVRIKSLRRGMCLEKDENYARQSVYTGDILELD